MLKRLPVFFTALVIVALTACSSDSPQPSPVPTLEPTTTPTPIPLSQLDLEPLLIQSGDLPARVSGAQVRSDAPRMFDAVPKPDNAIYQQFESNGKTAGGVAVFLYEVPAKVGSAYQVIASGIGKDAQSIPDIGDKAIVAAISMSVAGVKIDAAELLFTRCTAVVHVRMGTTSDVAAIASYAKRLDRRLKSVVCR